MVSSFVSLRFERLKKGNINRGRSEFRQWRGNRSDLRQSLFIGRRFGLVVVVVELLVVVRHEVLVLVLVGGLTHGLHSHVALQKLGRLLRFLAKQK
jgi:hypothetical protein